MKLNPGPATKYKKDKLSKALPFHSFMSVIFLQNGWSVSLILSSALVMANEKYLKKRAMHFSHLNVNSLLHIFLYKQPDC